MTPTDFFCDYCQSRPGAPCVTRFLGPARPHKSRVDRHASATDKRQRSILDGAVVATITAPLWTCTPMTMADVVPDLPTPDWMPA